VGYLDDQDRFWFCGRKSHRLLTPDGPMYTIPCEAIFNQHEGIYRSALVGVGASGNQRPVLVAEPWPERRPKSQEETDQLLHELSEIAESNPLTNRIRDLLIHSSLPVDIRHNAKIFREKLVNWAAKRIR
jgi:hypothetical protein